MPESLRFLQERELWFNYGAHRMRYLHIPAVTPQHPSLPALVLVHGLLGYSFSWRHNLDFFSQHRDVYAVDLLGIGHSDRPSSNGQKAAVPDFSLSAAAHRLLEFMHTLGHEQIDLIGTSHGGGVVMMTASQDRASANPLVRRLVLVAPIHPFMTNARFRLALFRTPFGRFVLRAFAKYSKGLRVESLGRMYADSSLITPETRAGYAINLDDLRSYTYALEVVRTWREDMQQLKTALPAISLIPALLLWGQSDQAVDAASGLLLRESFRNAQYVVLPGVGHLPYEEAPVPFNRHVLQFLDSE